MDQAKIQLLIGALLIIALPLVCYLDKQGLEKEVKEQQEAIKERQEAIKIQNAEEEKKEQQWKQEREEKERKEEEQKKRWARDAEKMKMAETLEDLLETEWSNIVGVKSNGNFDLPREVVDGEWETYTFNITGTTLQKQGNATLINGVIKVKRNDVKQDVNSLIISRNPAIYALLEKFKSTILEDLGQ